MLKVSTFKKHDTEDEYVDRHKKFRGAGRIVGLGAGLAKSQPNLKAKVIGGAAGLLAGKAVGSVAHSSIYGHRRPEKKEKSASLHAVTIAAFHDELAKIAGVMEDAAKEYASMMKKHSPKPEFRAALHPSERGMATSIADKVQALKPQTGGKMSLTAPSLAQMQAKAGLGKGTIGKVVKKVVSKVASVQKTATNWHHAAEIAGLGTLAAPTIQKMRGKPMKEKNKDRAEMAGLGILAVPAAHELGKKAIPKLKSFAASAGKQVLKHASAEGGDYKRHWSQVPSKNSTAGHWAKEKKAFFTKLLKKPAAEAAKKAFQPSFKGHSKALGLGTKTNATGVTTTKALDSARGTISKSKYIEIPGLT